MPHVKIVVKEIEDTTPAIEVTPGEQALEVELKQFTILEKGMGSGKASVSFYFQLPDGTHVIAQTSAEIMHGMDGALRGAESRFAEKLAKKN